MKTKPAQIKLRRNDPRDLPGDHWYYVNDRTVDVILNRDGDKHYVRLGETHLRRMLSELRPKRKAAKRR